MESEQINKIKIKNYTAVDRKEILDDDNLNSTEKWLLIIIRSFIHDTCAERVEVSISQENIIKLMGCSVATFKKARQSLIIKKKIDYKSNFYSVLFITNYKSYTKAYYSILYNSELSPKEKLTLIAMEHFIRQDNNRSFNKSLSNIAQAMGYNKSSVSIIRNVLNELRLKRYVSFGECKGGVSKGIGITYNFSLMDFTQLEFYDMTNTLDSHYRIDNLNYNIKKTDTERRDQLRAINKAVRDYFRISFINVDFNELSVLIDNFGLVAVVKETEKICKKITDMGIKNKTDSRNNIEDLRSYIIVALRNNLLDKKLRKKQKALNNKVKKCVTDDSNINEKELDKNDSDDRHSVKSLYANK